MKRFASKFNVFFLAVIFLIARPVLAQNSGSIQGTVVDPQARVIPGATVKAIDEEKGIVIRDTITTVDGRFLLQPLDPGTYTIRVSAKGMKDLEDRGVTLDSRQVLGLGELTMALGAATESVTVEATVPLVETATADHSAVIDSHTVLETSMNGRDFQSLVRTLPGVVSNDSSDFRLAFNNTDSFHVDGLRGSNNNVYLDGAINTDVGANDGQFTQLSMDAVGEFKLQTSNFAAEYGRNPGVLLAINTKSGSQHFHGTVYEFNRENGFDANPFFNKVNTAGLSKTPVPNAKLRFNQFGANAGGPIPLPGAKKKLFFFYNYEGTRASKPNGVQTYSAPNAAWQTGDFSSFLKSSFMMAGGVPTAFHVGQIFHAGSITRNSSGEITGGNPYPNNQIPLTDFGNQFSAWMKLLGTAYRPGATPHPGDNSLVDIPFQDIYTFNKNQHVVRIDYNINAKTNFFFRWVDDSQREAQGFGIFSGNSWPVLPEFRKKPGSSWWWNLVNVLTPTITNEFIFSYNHLTQVVDINGAAPSTFDKDLLGFTYQDFFPNANIHNTFPKFSTGGGIQSFPFAPGWHSEARAFTWTDNVTKVYGVHAIKFGIFFDYNQAGQQPFWEHALNLSFDPSKDFPLDSNNGLANLLIGNYNTATQTNGVTGFILGVNLDLPAATP